MEQAHIHLRVMVGDEYKMKTNPLPNIIPCHEKW